MRMARKRRQRRSRLAPPLYVALDPPFVVNFEAEQLVRFLQVTVQVMTRDPQTVELLKANDPVVRNDLLLLFANQKYDVVGDARRQGKTPLRRADRNSPRSRERRWQGRRTSKPVYFTSFVMQ